MTRSEPISHSNGQPEVDPQGTVSFRADVPQPLLEAMTAFIERHPNWDQYRLIQASLAGFLVQNGVQDRGVTRCLLANLFPAGGRFAPLPGSQQALPHQLPAEAPRRPWEPLHRAA